MTDVTPDSVLVDANHPLAGERVWFPCTVQEVRRASADEIAAGHAEGVGLTTQ